MLRLRTVSATFIALVAVTLSGCSSPEPAPAAAPDAAGSLAQIPIDETPLPPVPSPYDALPENARLKVTTPFTGDLDELVKRRLIRAGVVFSRTHYFVDKGVQRGMSYDAIQLFEEQLNKRLKTGLLKVYVVAVPLSRDQLFPALQAGIVDFVVAALTITPERQAQKALAPEREKVPA